MSEIWGLTDKGIEFSLNLLIDSKYLAEGETSLSIIKDACEKYLDAFRAKGDNRTEEETEDAVLMVLFRNYVKNALLKVN